MEMSNDAKRRLCVLSTEDDPLVRTLLAELLLVEGHDIEFARNSDDFFRLVGVKTYDLLILDVNVPGLNGYKIAREIGARLGAQCPKMMLFTGRDTQAEKGLVLASGVDAVLEKGCPTAKILETISQLMAQPTSAGPAPAPTVRAPAVVPDANRLEFERLVFRVNAMVSENGSLSQRLESITKRHGELENTVKGIRAKLVAPNQLKWAFALLGLAFAALLNLFLR